MKPLGKVKTEWSAEFAYAIGLLTTDGSLSKDGRHINFTSKDRDLVMTFKRCLKLDNVIGRKTSGSTKEKKYFQIQFGDVLFYRFLVKLGLMPNKTKKLGDLNIPQKYFFHFLRGHFDGDGTIYSYFDKRWKRSFMFYTVFCSASLSHILWLRREIYSILGIQGHINRTWKDGKSGKVFLYQLKFAKKESFKLLKKLYQRSGKNYLERKYQKIQVILAQVEELADSSP